MQNNKQSVLNVLKKAKNKAIDVTSDVLSAPKRAYYGAKNIGYDLQRTYTVGNRNYKNRTNNENQRRSIFYWAKNKN